MATNTFFKWALAGGEEAAYAHCVVDSLERWGGGEEQVGRSRWEGAGGKEQVGMVEGRGKGESEGKG